MFFVHKYAPKNKDDIMFHKSALQTLENMASDVSVPHTIFYGPEGSGKKTLIKMFLEMIYDDQVHKLNDSTYKVSGSGNSTTDVIIKQSNYHIVIEPNNNNFDRYLIQDVVKEYAKKIPLNIFTAKKTFKIVLINNVDNLSYYAQTSLRRTMEKYSSTCRFVMWARSLSRVIDPIKSRCYCFRINAPSNDQLFDLIAEISYKESIDLKLKDYYTILKLANRNIKKILWLLQCKKIGDTYTTSYDEAIQTIIELLLNKKDKISSEEIDDTNSMIQIIELAYNIMITNFAGTRIIKSLVKYIYNCPDINERSKFEISEIAAKYEHNLIRGRREIIHFEAFIKNVKYSIYRYDH